MAQPYHAPEHLTSRQRSILEAVASFHATHGYGPSVRDVTAAVGYKSSGSCDYQIKQLCDLGHLTHDRRIPRSLRVVDLEVVDGE